MRNMHIFDAIQHTDTRPSKTCSCSCSCWCEIDVDHKRAPEVALCDARLRSPGTVTPGLAVQSPAPCALCGVRAHRVACALHISDTLAQVAAELGIRNIPHNITHSNKDEKITDCRPPRGRDGHPNGDIAHS